MKGFLTRSLFFFSSVGLLLIGLDLLLMHGLQQRQTHVLGVWNRLMAGELNAQVLFAGSSRTFVHYDAAAIGRRTGKRCYNIGMDGSQLNLQYPWLKNYLELNEKPELIVQGVDIISLRPDTDVFFPTQYPPYLRNKNVYEALKQIDPVWKKHRSVPFYSFSIFGAEYVGLAAKGLLHLEDIQNDPLELGYEKRDLDWDGTFDRFKKQHPQGKRYGIDKRAIDQLRQIVQLAKAHRVPIVLVYAPELKENFALTQDRAGIFEVYYDLSAEMNVPFWDLSQMGICAHRKYFYNSQHLNAKGVSVLTKEISDRIIRSIAIGQKGK